MGFLFLHTTTFLIILLTFVVWFTFIFFGDYIPHTVNKNRVDFTKKYRQQVASEFTILRAPVDYVQDLSRMAVQSR